VKRRCSKDRGHGGFSLVETTVGLSLLAFGLSGLITMIAVSSRQLEAVEERTPEDKVLHLVPDASDWAVRLGASARITETPPARRSTKRTGASVSLSVKSYSHEKSTGEIALEVEVGKAGKR